MMHIPNEYITWREFYQVHRLGEFRRLQWMYVARNFLLPQVKFHE